MFCSRSWANVLMFIRAFSFSSAHSKIAHLFVGLMISWLWSRKTQKLIPNPLWWLSFLFFTSFTRSFLIPSSSTHLTARGIQGQIQQSWPWPLTLYCHKQMEVSLQVWRSDSPRVPFIFLCVLPVFLLSSHPSFFSKAWSRHTMSDIKSLLLFDLH